MEIKKVTNRVEFKELRGGDIFRDSSGNYYMKTLYEEECGTNTISLNEGDLLHYDEDDLFFVVNATLLVTEG